MGKYAGQWGLGCGVRHVKARPFPTGLIITWVCLFACKRRVCVCVVNGHMTTLLWCSSLFGNSDEEFCCVFFFFSSVCVLFVPRVQKNAQLLRTEVSL